MCMGGISCSTNVYLIASFHGALSRLDCMCEPQDSQRNFVAGFVRLHRRGHSQQGILRFAHELELSHRYGERWNGLDTVYAVVGNRTCVRCRTGLLMQSPELQGRQAAEDRLGKRRQFCRSGQARK